MKHRKLTDWFALDLYSTDWESAKKMVSEIESQIKANLNQRNENEYAYYEKYPKSNGEPRISEATGRIRLVGDYDSFEWEYEVSRLETDSEREARKKRKAAQLKAAATRKANKEKEELAQYEKLKAKFEPAL